jgi:hypothetical protein
MTPLRFYFPYFFEQVSEGAIEPPHEEVKAVARRMGCNEETARAVVLHRRAIWALREAEETGYLQHIRALSEKLKSGELEAAALSVDFAERLNRLREQLAARGAGRPQRSIYAAHELSELFSFIRQTQSYGTTLEWLTTHKRRHMSAKNSERILSNYKKQKTTGTTANTSVWDPDFERFFAWATKFVEPRKVKLPASAIANVTCVR